MDAADYVLKDFSGVERKDLPLHVAEGAEAVREVAVLGWERAQARLHTISTGG
jgi:PTH1 family peptidyl-tRNA hydrolase